MAKEKKAVNTEKKAPRKQAVKKIDSVATVEEKMNVIDEAVNEVDMTIKIDTDVETAVDKKEDVNEELTRISEEVAESKERLAEKIESNPQEAENVIKEEIKKVEELEKKVDKMEKKAFGGQRYTSTWNGISYGGW